MGFSISIPFGSRGRAPRVTIYQRSGGCCSGIFGLAFLVVAVIVGVKSCGPDHTTESRQQPAPQKTTAENIATNERVQKLKQSIAEAKQSISANPAPVIQAATRAIVEEKTAYKSLTFRNLECRKHAEGRLLIQHFTLDGKPYRIGFLERTPGDFADIDPNKLKNYISESTPSP